MTIASRIVSAFMKLPPATHAVELERVEIPMPDGATLRANRYVPRGRAKAPLVLVRSPYGRDGVFGLTTGRLYAERGFQVLVVSVRGTFGSGDHLTPFLRDRADGLAVLEWMRAQPWYPGAFGTSGPSYLGFVQWAIAADAGPELKAMSLSITASEFRGETYAGESFSLATALEWVDLVTHQEGSLLGNLLRGKLGTHQQRAAMHLPLCEADRIIAGRTVDFFQDWLQHNALGDPWWKPGMFDDTVERVTAAAQMTTGWYDLFLPWQLRDYARLKAVGRAPRLRIGPWSHAEPEGFGFQLRDSLAWLKHHLDRAPAPAGALVQIFVQGAKQWRELVSWPPPSSPARFHLHPQKRLLREPPAESAPDTYRYDPADPTPSVGGPRLQDEAAGTRDNRELEARADVLTFTTAPLDSELEIIGTPEIELFAASSVQHTDFFARLCDVHPNGKSLNVCDALFRVSERPSDGVLRLTFSLWPTAHRFLKGHSLRVQISSGAHPRYARNLGTGEPLATGTRMQVAEQRVFHDPARPSAIVLPVV